MKAAHVIISGKVQGVFFRATVQQEAKNLNIKGWIRNLPTGEVEGFFEGDDSSVKEIINFCKIGPNSAEVENCIVEEQTPKGYKSFKIL